MSKTITNGFLAGIDTSPAIINYVKTRFQNEIMAGRIQLRRATVETIPYPEEHFTKVCSVNSIFYWLDLERGLSEIYRVLKKEGVFVVCFTCKGSLEKKRFAKYIRLVEADSLAQLLEKIGFRDPETLTFSDKYRQYSCIVTRKGR